MNTTTVYGNLVADVELNTTANGIPVANFRVASNRSKKPGSGADFIRVRAWKHLANSVAADLAKGHFVKIEGTIRTESWTDKSGAKRTSTVLVARKAARYEKAA
jgi:single-strand DNA-binding protein